MKIYGSGIPFHMPARTFVIDGSVAHPVLPFVEALTKEKFKVTSAPGEAPVRLRYGSYWKDFLINDTVPHYLLPKKLARWELTIQVMINVVLDEFGNHAVTITGFGFPSRGNDELFSIIGKVADAYSQSGQLLHWTDYFQGDHQAMKARKQKK